MTDTKDVEKDFLEALRANAPFTEATLDLIAEKITEAELKWMEASALADQAAQSKDNDRAITHAAEALRESARRGAFVEVWELLAAEEYPTEE